jgi:CRISPR/Cas system CSM-associated protein Csm3 (group 7 of RAMP superfamily)
MSGQWENHRNLVERILVKCDLTLETPTHLGNGDSDGLLDMPLHLDPLEGRALLTGTSLAGGLRNYVYRYNPKMARRLFGYVDTERTEQSLVIVDDALGNIPQVELRDGVAIDPKSRTAADRHKYDIELLEAGTTFPLSFELLVRKRDSRAELLQAFALALSGLEKGEIPLGKRKRRGHGRCSATNWQIQRYNMTNREGMLAWLKGEENTESGHSSADMGIAEQLGVTLPTLPRPAFSLDAVFALDGSLLIRSTPDDLVAADTVHLRSARVVKGKREAKSILSGTSLAGALRARALRIANTLGLDGESFVDVLFGYRRKGQGDSTGMFASRLWVEESVIEKPLSLVQSRVKIDRFTGGSFPGALFAEEPVFGVKETRLRICLTLEAGDEPLHQEAEIGMLLLLLKDLWTGDLPLGGASSVGRGRLSGEHAAITVGDQQWTIHAQEGKPLSLSQEAEQAMGYYVTKLRGWRNAKTD